MNRNNKVDVFDVYYWNGYNLKPITRTYERASLVPAAAVIPALMAYIVIVAVKKLVVGCQRLAVVRPLGVHCVPSLNGRSSAVPRGGRGWRDYFEQIRVLKTGLCLNDLAWNNGIGLRFYFVGSRNRSND